MKNDFNSSKINILDLPPDLQTKIFSYVEGKKNLFFANSTSWLLLLDRVKRTQCMNHKEESKKEANIVWKEFSSRLIFRIQNVINLKNEEKDINNSLLGKLINNHGFLTKLEQLKEDLKNLEHVDSSILLQLEILTTVIKILFDEEMNFKTIQSLNKLAMLPGCRNLAFLGLLPLLPKKIIQALIAEFVQDPGKLGSSDEVTKIWQAFLSVYPSCIEPQHIKHLVSQLNGDPNDKARITAALLALKAVAIHDASLLEKYIPQILDVPYIRDFDTVTKILEVIDKNQPQVLEDQLQNSIKKCVISQKNNTSKQSEYQCYFDRLISTIAIKKLKVCFDYSNIDFLKKQYGPLILEGTKIVNEGLVQRLQFSALNVLYQTITINPDLLTNNKELILENLRLIIDIFINNDNFLQSNALNCLLIIVKTQFDWVKKYLPEIMDHIWKIWAAELSIAEAMFTIAEMDATAFTPYKKELIKRLNAPNITIQKQTLNLLALIAKKHSPFFDPDIELILKEKLDNTPDQIKSAALKTLGILAEKDRDSFLKPYSEAIDKIIDIISENKPGLNWSHGNYIDVLLAEGREQFLTDKQKSSLNNILVSHFITPSFYNTSSVSMLKKVTNFIRFTPDTFLSIVKQHFNYNGYHNFIYTGFISNLLLIANKQNSLTDYRWERALLNFIHEQLDNSNTNLQIRALETLAELAKVRPLLISDEILEKSLSLLDKDDHAMKFIITILSLNTNLLKNNIELLYSISSNQGRNGDPLMRCFEFLITDKENISIIAPYFLKMIDKIEYDNLNISTLNVFNAIIKIEPNLLEKTLLPFAKHSLKQLSRIAPKKNIEVTLKLLEIIAEQKPQLLQLLKDFFPSSDSFLHQELLSVFRRFDYDSSLLKQELIPESTLRELVSEPIIKSQASKIEHLKRRIQELEQLSINQNLKSSPEQQPEKPSTNIGYANPSIK